MSDKLLDVSDLHTTFNTEDGIVPAIDGVSIHVNRGETVALVGESGSGKSVTALSVMRLIDCPPGQVQAGHVLFDGIDLFSLSEEEMCQIRGNRIAMIFQEPMTSLNPVMTVGEQIGESLDIHKGIPEGERKANVIELLRFVGIPLPEQRFGEYPHQMSGGMRQRVMIAMALACEPQLLIADEPTTALDVTIQAQILDLMRGLKRRLGMAILIITHDLGVVAEMAERVVVMYAGQIVEEAPVGDLFSAPLHPYTGGLLKSIPSIDHKQPVLNVIEGVVPSPMFYPKGCRFSPRCLRASARCKEEAPILASVGGQRYLRCWYPLGTEEDRP